MYFAIGIASFFCGAAGIGIVYMLCKRNGLKKDGEIISGRKLSCEEIIGRPNRYVVKAEYRINGIRRTTEKYNCYMWINWIKYFGRRSVLMK